MYTSLFLQTERMNVSIGHMRMSAALLNTFNTFIILVLVPIMEKCIWPVLEKYGKSPTNLQKIGTTFCDHFLFTPICFADQSS